MSFCAYLFIIAGGICRQNSIFAFSLPRGAGKTQATYILCCQKLCIPIYEKLCILIFQLQLPINGTDAANKDYVDATVAATGGGGSTKPEALSDESSPLTFSAAVQYCENLSEDGETDWRIPSADELVYFAGSMVNTNYLWTKSLADSKENPVNQNYISLRLSDGKWRNGGEVTGLLLGNSVSGNTVSTTFTTVATLSGLTPGDVVIPSHIKLTGYRSSNSPCCACSYARLKFNFANGSSSNTPQYCLSTSTTTALDMSSIPLFAGITPISSIELQLQAQHSTATTYGTLVISGYEIAMTQGDGATQPVRCVR